MNSKRMIRSTVGAAALVAAAGALFFMPGARVSDASQPADDPYRSMPTSLQLTGVVRDFQESRVSGGHPDFERQPTSGFAHYMQQAADELGSDGKPVFRSTGRKVGSNWRDAMNRNIINPKSYISVRSGDVNGSIAGSDGGSSTTAANFDKWFRDVPGVNLSRPLSITLNRQPNTNIYTFNDRTDPLYMNRGGFFAIDGELFGNSSGTPAHNFHFTFDLSTSFVYRRGGGQVFTFTGDDDVFVYIDNKLVIDIGGVHSAVSQTIELDRLNWLVDGSRYDLKFFFAERHRTQSNFRIDTTINLENAQLPTTAPLYD